MAEQPMSGLINFAAEVVDLVAGPGIRAVSDALNRLAPETRKAAAWVLVSRLIGWMRGGADPRTAPLVIWLKEAGVPEEIALRISADLFRELDEEVQAARPNSTGPSAP